MKIDDVVLQEADFYGFDDIKTAAGSFLKNLSRGAGWDDAKQYAMRDRAVRMVARGFQNQWKNIAYDLRRMYEPDIKKDPAKGRENISTINKRILNFVKQDMGVSDNNAEIANATKTIVDATIDANGAFQPLNQLTSPKVADAFTRLAANAVTNIAYQQQTGQNQDAVDNPEAPAQMLGNIHKTETPNDYGRVLDDPLDKMFDEYGERHWYDDAIIPVQIVIAISWAPDLQSYQSRRYIHSNGKWYLDRDAYDGTSVDVSEKYVLTGEGSPTHNIMADSDLNRAASLGGSQDVADDYVKYGIGDESILWGGNWGIQRVANSKTDFVLLTDEHYRKWATATGRTLTQSPWPLDNVQRKSDIMYDKFRQAYNKAQREGFNSPPPGPGPEQYSGTKE